MIAISECVSVRERACVPLRQQVVREEDECVGSDHREGVEVGGAGTAEDALEDEFGLSAGNLGVVRGEVGRVDVHTVRGVLVPGPDGLIGHHGVGVVPNPLTEGLRCTVDLAYRQALETRTTGVFT